jgi:hypothetical protein
LGRGSREAPKLFHAMLRHQTDAKNNFDFEGEERLSTVSSFLASHAF